MNIFRYKGYLGSIEADTKDKILYGKLLYINDLVTYESDSISGLEVEFKNAVDDYLKTCSELKREPLKPFKGSFNIRIGADLHREVALQAALKKTTINDFIKTAVKHEVENCSRDELI